MISSSFVCTLSRISVFKAAVLAIAMLSQIFPTRAQLAVLKNLHSKMKATSFTKISNTVPVHPV
ncbi:MAG: hypothetical protein V4629_10570 [Pseudomonadota bacterium]